MYVRHIGMRGERERKKSSKEVYFFLSIIMDGRQLKILTYPRRGILVEGGGIREHIPHICNAARVEVRDVPIEGGGFVEHPSHTCNTACVEVRDVPIEGGGMREHRIYTRNAACVEV